jgi:hypothetical protein
MKPAAVNLHKYGWMAKSFAYPIFVEQFDAMLYQLLAAGVTATLFEVPNKGVILVTWKKPWEAPHAVDKTAS